MLVIMSPRPTVLYAEDEVSLHGLVGFWLTEAGFDVRFALDGAEALRMIRDEAPDLLITDAMMPTMSGDELVAALKADPELSSIPIVMATAAASPLRIQRMKERGCVAVLGKPLDETSFIATAKAALTPGD